jgi:hypothetical protein
VGEIFDIPVFVLMRNVAGVTSALANMQTHADIYRHMQTYTAICRHKQTYTDIYSHIQTYATHADRYRHMQTYTATGGIQVNVLLSEDKYLITFCVKMKGFRCAH